MALTATEMVYETKIIYEDITGGDAPGFTPRQWSTILTQAQEEFFKEKIKEGLFLDEDNKMNIHKQLRTADITSFVAYAAYPNAIRVNNILTSQDYIVKERCTAVKSGVTKTNIAVKPISYDAYSTNVNNPFIKPDWNEYFWRMEISDGTDNRMIIITDTGCTLTHYYIDYLLKPTPIIAKSTTYTGVTWTIEGTALSGYTVTDLSCKLGGLCHRDICKIAARIAMASVKDQAGYQIQLNEDKN